MLIESIEILRGLWDGELFSHRGEHYVVENARIYTLPDAASSDHGRGIGAGVG